MEMLNAMREGFNIVGISNHLMYFTTKDFEKYFVGLEIYTAKDVIKNLKFICDNDHEIIQFEFKNIIEDAILKLGENHGKLIEFVKFISGSTILQPTNKLIITPVTYGYGEVPFWPEYPLPKAQTCFNRLFVPYLLCDELGVNNGRNNENEKEKENRSESEKENNNENRIENEIVHEERNANLNENPNENPIEDVVRMEIENNENNNENNNEYDNENNENENKIGNKKDENENENKNKNFSVWNVENVLKSFENILFFNKEAFSDN